MAATERADDRVSAGSSAQPAEGNMSQPSPQALATGNGDLQVCIERLEPIRVASARASGKSPEAEAWNKLAAWARPIGLLDDLEKHPVFGFNNPDPSPGREEYGYEFWVVLDREMEPGPEIELKHFAGGLYAVTCCNLHDEVHSAFFQEEGFLESWKKLHDWVEDSRFKPAGHQALEKPLDPDAPEPEYLLELYYPIEA